jgi:hypothetical protein
MKRPGWTTSLLVLLAASVTLALAGDALAGDKKGKKDKTDKKDKKGKKELIVRKDNERTGAVTDPTRAKKSSQKLGSSSKGKGSKGSDSKSQAQTRNQKKSQKRTQKRSCKRSSGGKR